MASKRLRQIQGVGRIVAISFLTELYQPGRFPSERELCKFLGLAPQVRSTGETQKRCGRHPAGQAALRSLLIEAAWQWRRLDPMAMQ